MGAPPRPAGAATALLLPRLSRLSRLRPRARATARPARASPGAPAPMPAPRAARRAGRRPAANPHHSASDGRSRGPLVRPAPRAQPSSYPRIAPVPTPSYGIPARLPAAHAPAPEPPADMLPAEARSQYLRLCSRSPTPTPPSCSPPPRRRLTLANPTARKTRARLYTRPLSRLDGHGLRHGLRVAVEGGDEGEGQLRRPNRSAGRRQRGRARAPA